MKTQKPIKWSDAVKSLEQEAKKLNFDMYSNKQNKQKIKSRIRYCYLVYCNKEPIVYSVYSSAQEAIKYAEYLIQYRKEFNAKFGLIVDFYYKYYNSEKDTVFDQCEKTIFSTCLSIKDKDGNTDKNSYSDDGCWVKVVRKPIRGKFGE